MVGALRQGEEPDLAPPRGVAQIEDLATAPGERPRVQVELAGILDGLPPSVDAAIFRLAQESITNAVRHARHATHVQVAVSGESDCVRMTVHDDGDPGPFDPRTATGFEAVALARQLHPDVCLFDIRMPGLDGIQATRLLAGPDVVEPQAVVVITTFDLDEYVHGALKAGARGSC